MQLALCIEELEDAPASLGRFLQAFCEVPADVTLKEFVDAYTRRFEVKRKDVVQTINSLEMISGRNLRR